MLKVIIAMKADSINKFHLRDIFQHLLKMLNIYLTTCILMYLSVYVYRSAPFLRLTISVCLLLGQAVQLINKLIDLAVGGVDLALE